LRLGELMRINERWFCFCNDVCSGRGITSNDGEQTSNRPMVEIRIHRRTDQGNVVAAYLLAPTAGWTGSGEDAVQLAVAQVEEIDLG